MNLIEVLTENKTLRNYRVSDRHVAMLMDNYARRAENLRELYSAIHRHNPENLTAFTAAVRKSMLLESILNADPELAQYNVK